MSPSRITVTELQQRKSRGERITMLTAYDYSMAQLLDEAGIDVLLVGDSLAMVVLGFDSTTPVTMEAMLHHAGAVRRGTNRAMVVGDLPAVSLGGAVAEAVRDARRFVDEAGCDAVKVEWKPGMDATARAIVEAGIAVMGHVGLTPQTAQAEGGFTVRGRDAASARRIVDQALALQEAGCFAMVLECVPDALAKVITARLRVPTIGIGAGRHCDGQVLVTYDLLGLFQGFRPKFVKAYADLAGAIRKAAGEYIREVGSGAFPDAARSFTMPEEEMARLRRELDSPR